MVPIIAIVGHKNSGKTTLAERLIACFTQDAVRVAAIKHTSDERGFDKPHADSDRLMQAGAVAVGLVARAEVGVYTTRAAGACESWLEAVLDAMPIRPDLIICEGYGAGRHPKIECIRDPRLTTPLATVDEGLFAVVSDHPVAAAVPVLAPERLEPIVRVIRDRLHGCAWSPVDQC